MAYQEAAAGGLVEMADRFVREAEGMGPERVSVLGGGYDGGLMSQVAPILRSAATRKTFRVMPDRVQREELKNFQKIPADYFYRVREAVLGCTVASVAVEMFLANLMGPDMRAEANGSDVPQVIERELQFVNEEIKRFVSDLAREQIMYGVSVVQFVPSSIESNMVVPVTLHFSMWTLAFEKGSVPRRWVVLDRLKNEILNDVMVVCKYQPDELGRLTSPCWHMLPDIVAIQTVENHVLVISDEAAHAGYFVTTSRTPREPGVPAVILSETQRSEEVLKDGYMSEKFTNAIPSAEDAMSSYQSRQLDTSLAHQNKRQDVQIRQHEDRTRRALKAMREGKDGSSYFSGERQRRLIESSVLGEGQDIKAMPSPKGERMAEGLLRAKINTLLVRLGVPSPLVNNQGVVYASNSAMYYDMQNRFIREFQEVLMGLIGDLFEWGWREGFNLVRQAQFDLYVRQRRKFYAVQKRLAQRNIKSIGAREAGSSAKIFHSSGVRKPVSVQISHSKGRKEGREMQYEKIIREAEGKADSLSRSKMVRFRFGTTPSMDLGQLRELHEIGAIDHECLSSSAVRLVGLPPDQVASSKARGAYLRHLHCTATGESSDSEYPAMGMAIGAHLRGRAAAGRVAEDARRGSGGGGEMRE